MAVSDEHARSMVRTLSPLVIATLMTVSLVNLLTGKLALALEVRVLEVVLLLLFVYLDERGWENVGWGQMEHPLAGLLVN